MNPFCNVLHISSMHAVQSYVHQHAMCHRSPSADHADTFAVRVHVERYLLQSAEQSHGERRAARREIVSGVGKGGSETPTSPGNFAVTVEPDQHHFGMLSSVRMNMVLL